MAIKFENFTFGEDVLKNTLPEFKALMRKHKVRSKKATEIYESIHGISKVKEDGNDSGISTEVIEDSE